MYLKVKVCNHFPTYLCFRLSESCRNKCISKSYHEGELTKGESVCLDRCAAKYLEVYERVGKKLTAMYAAQMQAPQ